MEYYTKLTVVVVFYDIMSTILAGLPLPASSERWCRAPFTRRQLDELCRVTPEMSPVEIQRRIRATVYPGALGAYVERDGHRVALEPGVPMERKA